MTSYSACANEPFDDNRLDFFLSALYRWFNILDRRRSFCCLTETFLSTVSLLSCNLIHVWELLFPRGWSRQMAVQLWVAIFCDIYGDLTVSVFKLWCTPKKWFANKLLDSLSSFIQLKNECIFLNTATRFSNYVIVSPSVVCYLFIFFN